MQNCWLAPGRALYPFKANVIKNILRLRDHFTQKGFPIFHAFIEHASDGSDMRPGEKLFNITGSEEAKIIPELSPRSGEYLVPKTRLSAFFGTDLLMKLRASGVRGVAIT